MADEYTRASMYGNADIAPDPSNSPPERWLDNKVDAAGVQGLVARMASGQLTNDDDFAAKMGDLGGTSDHIALHREFVAETGGPDPVDPMQNPVRPAVPADVANQPTSQPASSTTPESPADATTSTTTPTPAPAPTTTTTKTSSTGTTSTK